MSEAIVIYETQKGATRSLAEAVQAGLQEGGVKADLQKIDEVDLSSLKDYKAVILGTPTYQKDIQASMKAFLEELAKAAPRGKIGAVFGAYGWSGESHEILNSFMVDTLGAEMVDPGIKLAGAAGVAGLNQHREFGRQIAAKIKPAG